MSAFDDMLGGTPDEQAIGFKRHVVVSAIVFSVVEIVCIVVPLLSVLGAHIPDEVKSIRTAGPVFLGVQLIGWALFWKRLSPLNRAIRSNEREDQRAGDVATVTYVYLWKIPIGRLSTRIVLWFIVIATYAYYFVKYWNWEYRLAVQFIAMGLFHAIVANLGRTVWHQRVMQRVSRRLLVDKTGTRSFAAGYFRALMLVCMVSVTLTASGVASFVYFFLPLSVDQYLQLQTFFLFSIFFSFSGLYLHARNASRVITLYLDTDTAAGPGQRKNGLAMLVYRTVQSLPYKMLVTFLVLWLIIALLALLFAQSRLKLDTDDAVPLLGIIVVISTGVGLYQALWHREIFRELLDYATTHHRLPVRGIRTNLTLRTKLLISFGSMVFFAVGTAFFWGFVQYKNLVTKFVANKADLGIAWVRSEVQAAVAADVMRPSARTVQTTLARLSAKGTDSSAVYFYVPGDGDGEIRSYGGGPMESPSLPWYAGGQVRLARDTEISLRAHSLKGRGGPLKVVWQGQKLTLGSVAIFYPNYRGRGPSLVRPLKELLFFFLVLFGVCSGIVVLTVGQFVKPIRRLEKRADGMARGELMIPVVSGSEGDEVGRLTFALEEMRRALQEKLRSTEEVNTDLERAVQRRTADLAKKNRELAEALGQLTLAQDRLIRAEKMASIGQLVAGIAHEINNPVNAIVNTVGPLREAIGYLGADNENEVERGEAENDVKDMIRVVHRGAERTKAIVQALHNYSRTDDEGVAEIDINRSLDESLELLHHIFKQSIEVVRDYQEVGRVTGHGGQLNQVFMNLLTNARQAVANKEVGIITVATSIRSDKRVEVSVRDNGKGMGPDVMSKVFDPFFTTKDVGQGSGLGLSIVHGIVERHGGEIEVESHEGAGTVFCVILPRGTSASVTSGD